MGPDDQADRVESGGLVIDQHGQLAAGNRLHRDHGAPSEGLRSERGRVTAKEHMPTD